jgi:hypothetical protein
MGMEQEPFRAYKLPEEKEDEQRETFTISINKEERILLDQCKKILQQEKDSTAIKQLALEVGAKVLHEEKVLGILATVMNNYRKNKRLGIVTFD